MTEVKVLNKHHKNIPKNSVYIGRGSPYGNPFVIGVHGNRHQVINKFKCEILPNLDVSALRDKNLVCFCAPLLCHGDLILQKANQ